MPINRRGGGRKRFCGPTCRHRHWAATQPEGISQPAAGSVENRVGSSTRYATLEALRERLERDVETYGTLIQTPMGLKANPSAGELRRVIGDLNRLAPIEEEDAGEDATLRAV